MKYHIVSTSKSGHGAVFTNLKEAREYQKHHPEGEYQVFDRMPDRIPPLKKKKPSKRKEPSLLGQAAPDNITIATTDPIIVYTDGSALNNPGPGGWGVVIQAGNDPAWEYDQGYEHTTNNRMEMMAIITALEKLKSLRNNQITIHSDSQYALNGITKGWARGWKKKGWKKSDGKPALNPDLWARMLDLVDLFPKLEFKWVKGHAGNPLNERADELANGAATRGENMKTDDGYLNS